MHWLLHTSAGLFLRIAIGVGIFATLALLDYRRNGPAATRWREYAVLLAAVAAALLYGIINDQITVTISWEYFYYGKELSKQLGPAIPPDALALRWAAAKVGMMATWSAGLIFGVALLLSNNPSRSLPRLPYARLVWVGLPTMLGTAATCGIIGGLLGYRGALARLSPDFLDMVRANIFRPSHFMATWGVHLGGYVGGLLGTVIAMGLVLHQRRLLRNRLGWP
jgi:hypothetical protein